MVLNKLNREEPERSQGQEEDGFQPVKPRKKRDNSLMPKGRPNSCIDNLSDCILSHILSFLPTKDAVRTCILSSRWRFVWRFITQLFFNGDGDGDGIRSQSAEEDQLRRNKFRRFVINTILQHNSTSPIQKFRLIYCLKNVVYGDLYHLNSWFCECVGRAVEELDLSFREPLGYLSDDLTHLFSLFRYSTLAVLKLDGITCFDRSELPSSVCFPNLHTLHLSRTRFSVTSVSRYFPKLKILHLDSLIYERAGAQRVAMPLLTDLAIIHKGRLDKIIFYYISGPTLKSLKVHVIGHHDQSSSSSVISSISRRPHVELFGFQIDAPSLLSLDVSFDDCIKKSLFIIKSSSSIIKAAIHLNIGPKQTIKSTAGNAKAIFGQKEMYANANALFELSRDLSSTMEHLSLLVGTLLALSNSSVYAASAYHRTPVFDRLTRLDLQLDQLFNWCKIITSLLREMDNLQLLVLQGCFKVKWYEPLPDTKCLLPRLREVRVTDIHGCIDELGLFGYILKNANHLELMTVNIGKLDPANKPLLPIKLSWFPRGSQSCQIRFYDLVN